MESLTVACIQQRMSIPPTHEEFEAEARRFLRQAQAKAAQLTVFPELTGVMIAAPLISGFKLGFIKRQDKGKQRDAGFLSRSLGRLAGTTGGAVGGGFRGSLERLLRKRSHELRDAYIEIFGRLAREYGTAILGGSLYLYDEETDSVKNRAYLFDVGGEVLGYQDKLNLTPDEQGLASPGREVTVIDTRYGRLGLLIGRDVLYPEIARLLSLQGADLLIAIVASPGAAQAGAIRTALSVRVEENQVYAASSFMLGPNYIGQDNREDFFGQSALLAPISLTHRGDGLLLQTGTNHTEGIVAAELNMDQLYALRQNSAFRPRQQMHLGGMGPVLAEFYEQGMTIELAVEQRFAPPPEEIPEPSAFEVPPFEEAPPSTLEPEMPDEYLVPDEGAIPSVPEALSLTGQEEPEES